MNSYYHKMLLVGMLSATILTGETKAANAHIQSNENDQKNKVVVKQNQQQNINTSNKTQQRQNITNKE